METPLISVVGRYSSLRTASRGFSLLELLMAALLVVTAVVASLHSLQSGWLAYQVSSASRKASADLWNQSRLARHGPPLTTQSRIYPLAGTRPLLRSVIRSTKGGSGGLQWEVLRAEK